MRSPRLFRWKNLAQTTGALILAQRLEEALIRLHVGHLSGAGAKYHSRAKELSRAISDVAGGRAAPKSIRPIIEEVAASIHNDIAAKALGFCRETHENRVIGDRALVVNQVDRQQIDGRKPRMGLPVSRNSGDGASCRTPHR